MSKVLKRLRSQGLWFPRAHVVRQAQGILGQYINPQIAADLEVACFIGAAACIALSFFDRWGFLNLFTLPLVVAALYLGAVKDRFEIVLKTLASELNLSFRQVHGHRNEGLAFLADLQLVELARSVVRVEKETDPLDQARADRMARFNHVYATFLNLGLIEDWGYKRYFDRAAERLNRGER